MDAAKECPKCRFTSDSIFSDCPRCGVIISKFWESEKKRKEFESKRTVSERHSMENVAGSHMKKIVIFAIVAVGVWWGWTHVFQRSETDFVIESDGEYVAEAKISNGEQVDLKEHLAPGRYTVFLFYADW